MFQNITLLTHFLRQRFFWFFQYLLKYSRNYIFQNLSLFFQYFFKVSTYFFRVFIYWEVSILINNCPQSIDTHLYFIVSILPISRPYHRPLFLFLYWKTVFPENFLKNPYKRCRKNPYTLKKYRTFFRHVHQIEGVCKYY